IPRIIIRPVAEHAISFIVTARNQVIHLAGSTIYRKRMILHTIVFVHPLFEPIVVAEVLPTILRRVGAYGEVGVAYPLHLLFAELRIPRRIAARFVYQYLLFPRI